MRQLHTVQPGTPLTTALGMLLEAGVSVLPVVDMVGSLLRYPSSTLAKPSARPGTPRS